MDGSQIPSMGSTIHMRGSLSISPGREDKNKSKSPSKDRKIGLNSKLQQRSTTGSAAKQGVGVIRI
jgi:hypothetical protein